MAELLEFDSAASNLDGTDPGSPLAILTSSQYRLLAHSYASPEEQVLYASSVDTEGEIRASSRPQNRTITMSLEAIGTTAANARTALTALQAKIAKIRREGGTLKRTLLTGQVVIFDLVTAGQFDPSFDIKYEVGNVIGVDLTLQALPYGRGAQVTVSANNTTAAVINAQTLATVSGDVPALGRVEITDSSAATQLWAVWGLQQRYYSSSANAALFYEAEGRTRLGGASIVTFGGVSASGGASNNAVSMSTATSYQGILSTQATGGGAHLSHIGDFRVFARVAPGSSNVGSLTWALEWARGDFRVFTRNTPTTLPSGHANINLRIVDLGQVSIPYGTTRWEGRVIVRSDTAGDTAIIDSLVLIPTDLSGEVTASSIQPTPTAFTARDDFTGSGTLNAMALTAGGTWATAGATTDFSEGSGYVARTNASDTATRVAVTSAAAVTDTAAQIKMYTATSTVAMGGPVIRYTSATDFVAVKMIVAAGGWYAQLVRYTGGTSFTNLSEGVSLPALNVAENVWIKVAASASGQFAVWVWGEGFSPPSQPTISGYSAFLDGGSGKVGFFDMNTGSAVNRSYDNFAAWTPTFDAALFASQTLRVTSSKAEREDSAGSFYTDVSKYEGDYFKLPPAGSESRTTRLVVMTSRGLPTVSYDTGLDDKSVQVFYYPRYLVIP